MGKVDLPSLSEDVVGESQYLLGNAEQVIEQNGLLQSQSQQGSIQLPSASSPFRVTVPMYNAPQSASPSSTSSVLVAFPFNSPQQQQQCVLTTFLYNDPADNVLTKPNYLVYGLIAAVSGAVLFVLFYGIFSVHVPWLGIFAVLSIVPGFCVLYSLYWHHHRFTAFLPRVVKYIIIGMLGVGPVAIVELLMFAGYEKADNKLNPHVSTTIEILITSVVNSYVVASLCEELFKYIVASLVSVKPNRDIPYSVVIYSVSAAVGLASVENMMYIIGVGLKTESIIATTYTTVSRALLAVPLHSITGILIGVDVAGRKFHTHPKSWWTILAIPFLIHGTYDFCTIFAADYLAKRVDGGSIGIPLALFVTCVLIVIGSGIYAYQRRKELLNESTTCIPVPYKRYSDLA